MSDGYLSWVTKDLIWKSIYSHLRSLALIIVVQIGIGFVLVGFGFYTVGVLGPAIGITFALGVASAEVDNYRKQLKFLEQTGRDTL